MRLVVVLNPGPEDYDAFVEHLGIEHRAKRAHWHLRLSGPPTIPALRRGLSHRDARVRQGCVDVLDHLLDEESIEDVIHAVDDPSPEVASRALHALACDRCKEGACRPGEAIFVPKAVELVGRHPDGRVRMAAVDALGKVVHGREEAMAALTRVAQQDADRQVRKAAALRLPGGSIYERTRPRVRAS